MAEVKVKEEPIESSSTTTKRNPSEIPVINLDDDSDNDDDYCNNNGKKRVNNSGGGNEKKRTRLPAGFLDPLPRHQVKVVDRCSKQFWKAGDFDGDDDDDDDDDGGTVVSGGMDHLRVHPRFLHSNATSHKWVLGAFAELLDNSLDEVCNGATYVKIDMLTNKKDDSRMLLIEDNGGGMDPEKMRHCMSLGYSLKSKVKDTIGQCWY